MIPLTKDVYLVTGICGFIGSHIGEELVKQGKRVIGIDSLASGNINNLQPWWDDSLCTFHDVSITDFRDELIPIFKDVDIVFHEACSKCIECFEHPYQDLMTNTWGSWNIFEMCRLSGVKKIVHASSGSVLNGKPISFYGVSKLAGELYLRAFNNYYPDFRYTALRYYHVYGTRQNDSSTGGVIPIFIKRIYENKPITIHGTGQQRMYFTSVDDIVKVNFLMSENSRTDNMVFDVASDVSISILDTAKYIYDIMGVKPQFKFVENRSDNVHSYHIDNNKVKYFGAKFNNNFREQLEKVVKWYVDKYDEDNEYANG